jgi:hypothetical protein
MSFVPLQRFQTVSREDWGSDCKEPPFLRRVNEVEPVPRVHTDWEEPQEEPEVPDCKDPQEEQAPEKVAGKANTVRVRFSPDIETQHFVEEAEEAEEKVLQPPSLCRTVSMPMPWRPESAREGWVSLGGLGVPEKDEDEDEAVLVE